MFVKRVIVKMCIRHLLCHQNNEYGFFSNCYTPFNMHEAIGNMFGYIWEYSFLMVFHYGC